MLLQNKVLCWNCRGAGNGEFLREMNDLRRVHKPAIIILVEPKIRGVTADATCKKLGMNRWTRSDATEFSGGIWCLWSEDDVTVELRYAYNHFLHFCSGLFKGTPMRANCGVCPPPQVLAGVRSFGRKLMNWKW